MEPQNNMPTAPPASGPTEPHSPPVRPPDFARKAVRRKKVITLSLLGILAVALIGAAAYWFFVVKKDAPAPAATPTPSPAAAEDKTSVAADPTIATYKSSALNIEFSHRKDWKVRENAERSEVVVTSPAVTYTKADGSSASGVFTLKMRTGTIPEALQNTVIKSIAVRDSEVVAYDAPSPEQRQYTNITDAGVDANTFNFVIVSSSTGFKAGQALGYGVDLTGDAYLFAGGYGADASNTLTFDGVPKAEFVTPTYEQAVAIIKSLKVF